MRGQLQQAPISFADLNGRQLALLIWHMGVHLVDVRLVPGVGYVAELKRMQWTIAAEAPTAHEAIYGGLQYIITTFCPHARNGVLA